LGFDQFIPSVWSAKFLENLHKAQVFKNVCTTEWEGEIKGKGDSVVIPMVGAINVASYTGADMTDQKPTGATVKLLIDKDIYYYFSVDDIDKVQSQPEFMSELMREAAYKMSNTIDAELAALYTKAGSTITYTVTSANMISSITSAHRKLDEKDIARVGRWLMVSPAVYEKMVLANIKFNTENSTLMNGYVGNTLGFDVYMSNNVVETSSGSTVWECMAGTKRAIAYAQQMVSTEVGRKEKRFEDYVRGRMVYGYKVIDPNALVRATITVTDAESTI
jgi:hypothetical protein